MPPNLPDLADFMPLPPCMLQRLLPTDRFLISFPRSGSNWLLTMLALAAHGDPGQHHFPAEELRPLKRLLCVDLYHVDPATWRCDAPTDTSLLLKSHSWAGIQIQAPSIAIFRRPEDALVSWYRFGTGEGSLDPDQVDLETFVRGNFPWWMAHLAMAIDTSRKAPLLLLSYEQLHTNTASVLDLCLQHLGFDFNADHLRSVINATQPEIMRTVSPRLQIHRARPGDGANWLAPEIVDWMRAESDALYRDALARSLSPSVTFSGQVIP